ncbi:hypothetical protein ACFSSA_04110 [Luteolibacter algae]|uniref:O-antigen ligase domain-containing protein n=1 Tax=Luteolibacter algae TaxID=454151 RepID=A0ABW5D4T9_9BACT
MQQNAILKTLALIVFAALSVVFTVQIFSSSGNVLGSSFRYLTPLAAFVGLMIPRFAFYLLLFSGAYLDLIKRFMILDSRFSDIDLAFLLGFAPALVAGMVLKFVVDVIMKSPNVTKRDLLLFGATTFLCVGLGGVQLIMAGGLRGIGNGVNMVAYLYMPLLVPRIFRNLAEIKSLLRATVLIYLPAALWAIQQAHFGLANFEMQYLLSGMTIEIRQLDEEVFRNMGTMVSAHALSMVSSILAMALLLPVSWKDGKITSKAWFNPLRILCAVLFMAGAYYTFSRTGWACAIVALLAFICLQSRALTYTAFFTALVAVTTLYLSADYLLESRTMVNAQDILFEKFGTSAEMRQMMVLGTLDARLDSMASFATDPKLWTPFGLAAAGSNHQVDWIHDILTETLVMIGYIPLSIFLICFLGGTLIAFGKLFKMPKGPHRLLTTYFAALGIGLMSGGFSQGAMILYFPINFFWCMFLGVAYSIFIWNKDQAPEIAEAIPEQPLAPPQRRSMNRFGNAVPHH